MLSTPQLAGQRPGGVKYGTIARRQRRWLLRPEAVFKPSMVFSSALFLFAFLPVTLGGYFLARSVPWRNAWLLIASLIFYAWGEGFYLLILLVSIAMNFVLAGRIAANQGPRRQRWTTLAVTANLALLASYKYSNFIVENINAGLDALALPAIALEPVHLPLGISFFTFQAISYVVDVHRDRAKAQTQLTQLALYIALFPQLIAGPIVRYTSVEAALADRRVTVNDVAEGARRFVQGLAKKVLIANVLGETADRIFALPGAEVNASIAWLGMLCYALQIYFDFSGYSDMAIGLGRMLGFAFPENFNAPYRARSVRDFWRRWHISLSSWFRDYVYIPLGGNRHGTLSTWRNLLLVFFLTGLWHGASWNFIVWGLFHGMFLSIERTSAGRVLDKLPALAQHAYLLAVVVIGWVFFRADTLTHAVSFLQSASGLGVTAAGVNVERFLSWKLVLFLAVGTIACLPISRYVNATLARMPSLARDISHACAPLAADLCRLLLLLLCLSAIAAGTYNPFIYFRF